MRNQEDTLQPTNEKQAPSTLNSSLRVPVTAGGSARPVPLDSSAVVAFSPSSQSLKSISGGPMPKTELQLAAEAKTTTAAALAPAQISS